LGLGVWGLGFRVRGLGVQWFGVWSLGVMVPGSVSGFRVKGLGLRVWGLGFKVSGLGCGVWAPEGVMA